MSDEVVGHITRGFVLDGLGGAFHAAPDVPRALVVAKLRKIKILVLDPTDRKTVEAIVDSVNASKHPFLVAEEVIERMKAIVTAHASEMTQPAAATKAKA